MRQKQKGQIYNNNDLDNHRKSSSTKQLFTNHNFSFVDERSNDSQRQDDKYYQRQDLINSSQSNLNNYINPQTSFRGFDNSPSSQIKQMGQYRVADSSKYQIAINGQIPYSSRQKLRFGEKSPPSKKPSYKQFIKGQFEKLNNSNLTKSGHKRQIDQRQIPVQKYHKDHTIVEKQIIHYPPGIHPSIAQETSRAFLTNQGINIKPNAQFISMKPNLLYEYAQRNSSPIIYRQNGKPRLFANFNTQINTPPQSQQSSRLITPFLGLLQKNNSEHTIKPKNKPIYMGQPYAPVLQKQKPMYLGQPSPLMLPIKKPVMISEYFSRSKHQGRQYEGRQYEGRQHQGRQYERRQYEGRQHQGRQYEGRQHQGRQYEGRQYEGRQHQGRQYEGRQYEGRQHQRRQYDGRQIIYSPKSPNVNKFQTPKRQAYQQPYLNIKTRKQFQFDTIRQS